MARKTYLVIVLNNRANQSHWFALLWQTWCRLLGFAKLTKNMKKQQLGEKTQKTFQIIESETIWANEVLRRCNFAAFQT